MKNLLLGIAIGAIATLLVSLSINWKDLLKGAVTLEVPEMKSGEVTVTLPPGGFDFDVNNPPVKVQVTVPKASVTTLPPTVVYVADTSTKNKPNEQPQETITVSANEYKDTVINQIGTFYSTVITDGTLFNNSFSYVLNPIVVPDYWRIYGVGGLSFGGQGLGGGVGFAAFKGRYGLGYDYSYLTTIGGYNSARFYYLFNSKKDLKSISGKEDF